MNTFQQRYYLRTRNPLARCWRNVRLLGYIARVVWTWLFLGGRVRRALRRAEARGELYRIDFLEDLDL
jgi:hypothetical protein